MLVMILALSLVVGAFLVRGVRSFYLNEFYQQMETVFSGSELVADLRSAANEPDAARRMDSILLAHSGQLGIDVDSRNYYILSGDTGAFLEGSNPELGAKLTATPNIYTALAGSEGYASDTMADYMDVALPISGGEGEGYIVYICDNKSAVQELTGELMQIILTAMAVGLAIAVLLSLLLAKTVITPIQNLTRAAERVAGGDFSSRPETQEQDEIGILTDTFNDMADQLENTLDDLRRSEQMRREFVANVSHELRTPITSIRSYAETLSDAEGSLPPEMEQEFLGVIVKESDRMTNIVKDLLTLSRFDAGSIEIVFNRFSFEKSARDVYNAMLLEAQRHHHELTLEFKGELPEIRGDRDRIEQVLINMVSNAVKYTRDGGRIRIIAGTSAGKVWCEVRDNGIGIPEEEQGRVFERFYRVDKARSRESGGTGLGLSIAKEIVNRHSGELEISSRMGKGTTIRMTLPVEGPADE